MKKYKLGFLSLTVASLISLAAPTTAMARDRDDDYRRGYYNNGYSNRHERREREEHRRHEEREHWKYERRVPSYGLGFQYRSAPSYRNYDYGYNYSQPQGYYDSWGNWHPSQYCPR
jgi:hypothetical protein